MLIAAWSNFSGCNRKVHPKRLPEGVGANAVNLRLGFADMRTWRAASTVVTTGGATPLISAYRMNRATVSDTSAWIQWTTDVDVVRSLNPNDSTEEIYYTGDGVPKRTDNVLGLPAAPGPAASRTLGIPKPTAALTATVLVPGSGTDQTRVYVDLFRNDQGRASAPGVPRSIVCKPDATVTLDGFDTVPGGYPDVTLRDIYVSVDGSEYRRCNQIAVATTSVVDTGARGEVMESGGSTSKPAWEMPPSGLKGLIELYNGMLGGFVGKQFMVCEPGKPWAWPVEYQDTVFDDIVGTGKWGQNWVLLTTSTPVVLRGGPLLFDKQPVQFFQACVSKRSVVSMGNGVCWASPRGLCFIGDSGVRVLTEDILSPEQWEALNPSSITGARIEGGMYYGAYNDGTAKAFMLDPNNPRGIIFLTQGARGVFYDPISDRLYLQDTGNVIRRWNHPSAALLTGTFLTEVKRHPQPTNPGFAMIVADEPVSVAFKLYAAVLQADKTTVWTEMFSRTVTSGEPFSLPAGYMAQDFQVEVQTTGPVQGVLLAEDVADLP
jgi:hypothetical protein